MSWFEKKNIFQFQLVKKVQFTFKENWNTHKKNISSYKMMDLGKHKSNMQTERQRIFQIKAF